MTRERQLIALLLSAALIGCASAPDEQGTLAQLTEVEADLDEVYLEDGLERAAESYRRYLEETPETARTPEAMRRLADLQIEQEYGIVGGRKPIEMAAPDAAARSRPRLPSESTRTREAARSS